MGKPEGIPAGLVSDRQGCYCENGCAKRGDDCQEIRKFWPADLAALKAAVRRKALEEARAMVCRECNANATTICQIDCEGIYALRLAANGGA